MPIVVREATDADLAGVLPLYAQPGVDDGQLLPLDEARRIFARFTAYPDYHLYVAVRSGAAEAGDAEAGDAEAGEIVGTFAMLIMDNLGHLGAPSAVVEDVVVRPDLHGQGIGTRMMRFALERARRAGCYKLALSSNLKRDAAHAFYDALGFRRHGYSFLVAFEPDEHDAADAHDAADEVQR